MPKTNAERSREYRARKKAARNKAKKKVMTSTERVRKFRQRQKALEVISAVENACYVSYIQDAANNSNETNQKKPRGRPKKKDQLTMQECYQVLKDTQSCRLKKNYWPNNSKKAGQIKTEQVPEPFLNNDMGDIHHDPQYIEEDTFESNSSEEPIVKHENIDDNFDESCTWSSFGGSDGMNQYKSDTTSKVKSEGSGDTSFLYEIYSSTKGPIQNKEDLGIEGFKIKTEIDVSEVSTTPSADMQDIIGPTPNKVDLSIEGFKIKTEIDVSEDSITPSAVMQDIIGPTPIKEDLSIEGFKIKTEIDVSEDSITPSAVMQDIIGPIPNEEDLSVEGFKIITVIGVSEDLITPLAAMQDIIVPTLNKEDFSIKGFKIKTEIDVSEDSITPSAVMQDIIGPTPIKEDLSIEGFKIKTEIDVSEDLITPSAGMQDITIKEELDL